MEIIRNKDGIYRRKGVTVDSVMLKEVEGAYSAFDFFPDSIVMDLGANIGGFTKLCERRGIQNYWGYEPDESNFEVLRLNTPSGFNIIKGAVSHLSDKTLTFKRVNNDRSYAGGTISDKHTFRSPDGFITQEVDNYNIKDIVDQIKPTILKIDIEKAELDLFANWMPTDSIKQLALEVHGLSGIKWFEEVVHPQLLQLGFKLVRQDGKNFFKGNGKSATAFGQHFPGTLMAIDLMYKR